MRNWRRRRSTASASCRPAGRAERRIAWRHFTANRWRYELAATADGGTTVTETFDPSRTDGITDAVVRWAKFPERNRQGITETLQRLKQAAEADALKASDQA